MRKYKYIQKAFLGVVMSSFLFSCSENTMDRINEDDSNPLNVQAKFLATELLTSSAFSIAGGDLALYSSVYMEHEGGIFNQTYNAEMRTGEPTSASTYNNSWEGAYANIKLAKLIIKKCSPGGVEEGSNITLGIGKTMLAYNAAVLADLFGDIPYTEAGVLNEMLLPVYRQPKVEKQEDVYKDILKQLDEAIVLFDGKDEGLFGKISKNDYYYNGDGAKWKAAAYGLKARYSMRLLNKSADKTTELNNILSYIDKSFKSSATELKFDKYDGDGQVNPLAAFTYSRYGLGASQSLMAKLKERNDPRYTQVLIPAYVPNSQVAPTPISNSAKYILVENGKADQDQTKYSRLITNVSSSAPSILLSYHELLFLKAEALARLKDPAAEDALKDAIAAGFENLSNSIEIAADNGDISELPSNFDLSESASAAYYTNNVKALFDANPLKEIMIQKYLAFFGANGESMEAYNDYRRLTSAGENFITLANVKNATQFPLRFVYGSSDVVANPIIEELVGDGYYAYKENVWWAGGTR